MSNHQPVVQPKTLFSSSQALFTIPFLILFFTLLNGYFQNLVAGYRADTWLVLLGVLVELPITLWISRRSVSVQFDRFEIAGFVFVVVGVWLYFIYPALPTLLPPSQSSDAARVYLQVLFSFPEGKLVSWYPAGGTFVTAMFSHWLGVAPLRMMQPLAASFVALTAGAVYGMTCALLPQKHVSKILALFAPALLFVPWSYFAGTIDWEQYFFAQVFAQYFIIAALWHIAIYAERPHWIYAVLIGAALLGVLAAYPVFVALPLGLFGLIVIVRIVRERNWMQNRRAIGVLIAFVALLVLAAGALQRGGILELAAGQKSAQLDVGAGGVTNPSLDNLGGPVFLLLALIGGVLAWRAGMIGKTILALLLVWALQLIAIFAIQPFSQISGYRIDKTFYILVFPLAILAAFALARACERLAARCESSRRVTVASFVTVIVALSLGVIAFRPPKSYAVFTESELQAASWVKQHLDTYQVNYLDPQPTRAYWLAFGLWDERLPDEYFQWIPAGTKLGPRTFDEWLNDPAWSPWILARAKDWEARTLESLPVQVLYQNGDVAVLQKNVAPASEPIPTVKTNWFFGTTLRLIGYDLAQTDFSAGDTVILTTYTESIYPPPATVGWRVELVDRNGNVVSKQEANPFADKYPVQRWAQGKFARDVWSLPLDSKLAPGVYKLQMGLYRRVDGDFIDVHPIYAEHLTQEHYAAAPLTKIKIPVAPPSADELQSATQLEKHVGDAVTLLAYKLNVDRESGRAHLTLYWQGFGKAPADYTVFVHLLDSTAKVVWQGDREPRGGSYPTSIWSIGEIIKDEYALTIPADARVPLTLEIGMYTQPDIKRLPIGDSDHILIPFPE